MNDSVTWWELRLRFTRESGGSSCHFVLEQSPVRDENMLAAHHDVEDKCVSVDEVDARRKDSAPWPVSSLLTIDR